jgi:D-alanine-D-alanine ligase-like ATP-grasp enzyme
MVLIVSMGTQTNKAKERTIFTQVVEEMGGVVEEYIPERECSYITIGGKRQLLELNIPVNRKAFSTAVSTKHKEVTQKLLVDHGMSTPATCAFYRSSYNAKEAREQLETLTYPVIIKKSSGSNSRGIFFNVQDADDAQEIVAAQIQKHKCMIAQEVVHGKEYRVLVLDDQVIGVLEMIHPNVVGDGESTVKELIKEKQQHTKEKTKFNRALKQFLKTQGVSLRTVLDKGQVVKFKGHSCLAEGGETRDVTDLVHEDVKKICVKAAKVVGKYLVGIDLICEDIAAAPTDKNFNILEINGKPDLYIHYDPTYGESRDVVRKVLTFIFNLEEYK